MTAERFKLSTADVLDRLAFDEEAEAVGEMSEAELDAEMARLGIDVDAVDAEVRRVVGAVRAASQGVAAGSSAVGQGPSGAKPMAVVVPLHAPRRKESIRTRWVPFLAAAGAAVAVGFAGANRAANTFPVATVTYPTTVPAPTPEQIAAAVRKGALRRCEMAYYSECQDWLDAAKGLDPKGEDLPEVKAARARIAQAAARGNFRPEENFYSKPPVSPGERPLQPRH